MTRPEWFLSLPLFFVKCYKLSYKYVGFMCSSVTLLIYERHGSLSWKQDPEVLEIWFPGLPSLVFEMTRPNLPRKHKPLHELWGHIPVMSGDNMILKVYWLVSLQWKGQGTNPIPPHAPTPFPLQEDLHHRDYVPTPNADKLFPFDLFIAGFIWKVQMLLSLRCRDQELLIF